MKRRARRLLLGACTVAVGAVGLASLSDGPRAAAPTVPLQTPPPGERVRVEVLNAGGVQGMARDATAALRDRGFDVVDFGNAPLPSFDPERPSAVIDRIGRLEWAQSVADALGIDNVLSEPDPNLYVDVSVWLGSAWARPTGRGGEEERRERAWWDPRAWLSR